MKKSIAPEPPPQPPRYFDIPEAAAQVRTTEWAVAQAIRDGSLRAKKMGKKFITTEEFLKEWFDGARDAG